MSKFSRVATINNELPLEEIAGFPILRDVLQWWMGADNGNVPQQLDILDLPPPSWPYLMLVDLEGTGDARVALAGTAACDLYGHELRGTSVHDFFDDDDADLVLAALREVADSEQPKLTDRFYVGINGRAWSYTRLLLPIKPDGKSVARVLKALEPRSFVPA